MLLYVSVKGTELLNLNSIMIWSETLKQCIRGDIKRGPVSQPKNRTPTPNMKAEMAIGTFGFRLNVLIKHSSIMRYRLTFW